MQTWMENGENVTGRAVGQQRLITFLFLVFNVGDVTACLYPDRMVQHIGKMGAAK